MSEALTYEQLMAAIQADRARAKEEMQELRETQAETARIVKRVSRQLGGMSHRNGAMAETYFYNAFKQTKMFGNEKFDRVKRNVRGTTSIGLHDEYDIVLYNCESISIIEVKYAATTDNITQTLKKARTFREVFPKYKDCAIYLGLASLAFDETVERDILAAGIAVVKQVGKAVVVQDERMKKF